jgi:hypothetical protein
VIVILARRRRSLVAPATALPVATEPPAVVEAPPVDDAGAWAPAGEGTRDGGGAGLVLAKVIAWAWIGAALVAGLGLAAMVVIGAISVPLVGLFAVVALAAVVGAGVLTTRARRGWPVLGAVALVLLASGLVAWVAAWDGPVGRRTVVVATAAELDRPYRLAVGELVLDLSTLDPAAPAAGATPTTVAVEHKIGRLEVVVPADATVRTRARVWAGSARVLGRDFDGLRLDEGIVDRPLASTGDAAAVDLDLDLDMRVGEIRVCRAVPGADRPRC